MSLILPAVLGGRYELLEEIGTGAYASVYRAHDHVLDRAVAVKVLRDEVTSDETFARFEREVRVTATLEHAHILHVHDSGTHEGRPYIVTEYAPGGTLSEKLAREGQLQMADALQITCEVGIALAHAHGSGVVHRDVKPDNILLGRGGVLLADFGIAISDTDEFRTRLTRSGMAVGTVQYMSPEQLCAERDIDGRSDQYALACVLYEMLAGVRPHVAATVEGLRLQRLSGQHLPVRSHRPSVPAQVDAAIGKALSSMTADRHRDMPTFLGALGMAGSGEYALMTASSSRVPSSTGSGASTSSEPGATHLLARGRGRFGPRRQLMLLGLAGALALAAIAYPWDGGGRASPLADDMTRVLLTAPPVADSLSVESRVHSALREEIAAWPSVELVDRLGSGDSSAFRIRPAVSVLADSVRISLNVRRGDGAPEERRVSATTISDNDAIRILSARLVREALAGDSSDLVPGLDGLPVRSITALRNYVNAHRLLRLGLLDSAARAFRDVAGSPSDNVHFAQAHYWAAQAGAWREPGNAESWRVDVELALGTERLRGLDSLLATALQSMARAAFPVACEQYRAATALDPMSFVAWYGLGECARVDQTVLVVDGEPRFRSGLWSALAAYRSAVETAPTSALLATLFPPILQSTFADGSRVRGGISTEPAVARYHALPSLVNDTLAFFPIAQSAVERMQARTVPETFAAAIRRGRRLALDLTDRWVRSTPNAPEPWLFRAYALELSGRFDDGSSEPTSAMAALSRSVVGSPSAELRARVAVARTRILLRQGKMVDAARVASAALADTLLRTPTSASLLAPLAALLGDVSQLEALSEPTNLTNLPSSMTAPLDAFNIRAWMGACDDLDAARRKLEDRSSASFAPDERVAARARWLAPAYRAAVPCLGPSAIAEFEPQIPLDRAYQALAASDADGARRILEEARAQRGGASSSAVSWDYLYAESWALAQAGDSAAARAQLLNALEDIANMSGLTMDYAPVAAGLRRGLLLLRDLSAGSDGDEVLTRWVERADALSNYNSRGSSQ